MKKTARQSLSEVLDELKRRDKMQPITVAYEDAWVDSVPLTRVTPEGARAILRFVDGMRLISRKGKVIFLAKGFEENG